MIPDSISEDRLLEIQAGRFWINLEACQAFFRTLLGNEEMHKSGDEEFWSWGDTKRSDALVVVRNGAVEYIGVRLDANEKDQNLLEPLVEFAKNNALLFHVAETDRLLRPTLKLWKPHSDSRGPRYFARHRKRSSRTRIISTG